MTLSAAQPHALLSDITEGKWSLQYTGDKRLTGDLVAVEDGEHVDVVSCERGILREADGLLIEAAPVIARQLLRELDKSDRIEDALYRVIGYALTARSESKEWLEGMAGEINRAAELVGDPDRAVVEGDGLRVRKGAATMEEKND